MRAPLVLVPGIDGSGHMYHRQVPRLERRFAVTTVRLRDDAVRMAELVDDLHASVSAAAGDGPVTLMGESFGGALAMSYALAHPARVERLVILNSFARIDTRARLWLAQQLLRATPWRVMPLVREINARRMFSSQTDRDEIRLANELLRASTREGYRSRIGILREYDLRPHLPHLAAPVLFLAADRDTLVPSVAQAQLMRSLAPQSTLRILEGHGHSCLVAPDLDLAAILDEWMGEG
jgi:3-oxoadipate enol-lactonase